MIKALHEALLSNVYLDLFRVIKISCLSANYNEVTK